MRWNPRVFSTDGNHGPTVLWYRLGRWLWPNAVRRQCDRDSLVGTPHEDTWRWWGAMMGAALSPFLPAPMGEGVAAQRDTRCDWAARVPGGRPQVAAAMRRATERRRARAKT